MPGAEEHVGVVALITRAACLAVLLTGALGLTAPAQAELRVVAATTDLAAIAAAVGGDLVTVETIVPAAVDPEAFEPRPGDLEKIRNAGLLVRVGLGYDYWLDKLVRQTADKRLMRAGEAYVESECPRGQMGFYVVGSPAKSLVPLRVRARSSSFSNLSVTNPICRGCLIADVPAIVGSIDIVMGEIDR